MPKYSKTQRKKILESVIQADIMRLSIEETIQYVKNNNDLVLSPSYISEIRKTIRSKGREYISLLAKNRDFYISEYLTLIEGAKFSEGELYKIVLSPNTTIMEKIAAHRELGKYKGIIAGLMSAMPVVSGLMQLEEEETKVQDMRNQLSIFKST